MLAAEQAGVQPVGAAWAGTSLLRTIEPKEGWLVFERVEDFAAWMRKIKD
jgi:hypothetical protein